MTSGSGLRDAVCPRPIPTSAGVPSARGKGAQSCVCTSRRWAEMEPPLSSLLFQVRTLSQGSRPPQGPPRALLQQGLGPHQWSLWRWPGWPEEPSTQSTWQPVRVSACDNASFPGPARACGGAGKPCTRPTSPSATPALWGRPGACYPKHPWLASLSKRLHAPSP